MKLAEALVRRADLQRRIEELRQRALRNSRVQEGDSPAEPPSELLAQYEALASELTTLIQQINHTNSVTLFSPGVTISDAVVNRDILRMKQSAYRELALTGSTNQMRVTRSEIKIVSTIDVAQIQALADDYARQHRELDNRLQEVNWQTDLLERG